MRKYIVLAECFILLNLVTACTSQGPIVKRHADGRLWVTGEQLMRYEFVRSGSYDIGKVSFPKYQAEWIMTDSAKQSGTDDNPIWPDKWDVPSSPQASPAFGNQYYIQLPAKYYLLFENGKWQVEVNEGTWKNFSPANLYATREIANGSMLVIVPDK